MRGFKEFFVVFISGFLIGCGASAISSPCKEAESAPKTVQVDAQSNISQSIEPRDLFAASFASGAFRYYGNPKVLAKDAYKFADVMMEVREATRKK